MEDHYSFAYNYALSNGEDEEMAKYFADVYLVWVDWYYTEYIVDDEISEEEQKEGFRLVMNNTKTTILIYKNLISYGHSPEFSKLVADCLDEFDNFRLHDAYDLLSKDEAWNEAYNEYRIKGKSEIFCQRIAGRIQNRNEKFIDFKNIEKETDEYESCYNEAIKNGKEPALANFYADMVASTGYYESFAYGVMLMKEKLIKEFHSADYIELFIASLLHSRDVSYKQLDYQSFLPDAEDFYYILRIYKYTDCCFVGQQNNLTKDENNILQDIAEKEYFEEYNSSEESRRKAMTRSISKFNRQSLSHQIVNWTLL